MARPVKNNADYFSHDNDMRNHRKVKAIRVKYGMNGYGIWVMFLEVLTASEENRWIDNELEIELLAGDFGVSVTEIRDILDYCIRLGLLFSENGRIYSKTLDENLRSVYEKRNKAKLASQNQSKKASFPPSPGVSVTETRQIKEDKTKVKKEISTDVDKENSSAASENSVKDPIPAVLKNRADLQDQLKNTTDTENLIDLDQLGEIMRESRWLFESAATTYKISETDFYAAINGFLIDKKAVNYKLKSESDGRQHFLNWIPTWQRKQAELSQSGPAKGKIEKSLEVSQSAADRIKAARSSQNY